MINPLIYSATKSNLRKTKLTIMNIDIDTFRARVGLFGPGRGFRGCLNKSKYNPNTVGSDIHLRVIALYAVILFVFWSGTYTANSILDTATVTTETVHFPYDPCQKLTSYQTTCVRHQTVWSQPTYANYIQQRLILSKDVETNPGPQMDQNDKDDIMNAIFTNSESLKREIQNVRSDTVQIKSDVESVKAICAEVKQRVDNLEGKHQRVEENVRELVTDVQNLKYEKETMVTDIDALQETLERQRDKIDILESAVEKLEREKLKCSMRIFGLFEPPTENANGLKSSLENNVLNVAKPDHNWQSDSIIDAYRVGQRNDKGQRIVIVKFNSASEKHLLYSGREALRRKGIRISEELTSRERDILNNLRLNGRTGYFQKGKLHIRPETSNQPNRSTTATGRYFATGARRSNQSREQHMEAEHGRSPVHSEPVDID